MDFQSAMETFAEAWVAANTQTPLTEAAEAQALSSRSGEVLSISHPHQVIVSDKETEMDHHAVDNGGGGGGGGGGSGHVGGESSRTVTNLMPRCSSAPEPFHPKPILVRPVCNAAKSIPVHCIVEQVPSPQNCDSHGGFIQTTVELDSYAIVPSGTPFCELVKTALVKLGYSSSDIIGAKGAIQIKNWKPLAFETITEDSTATVAGILGELTTVATLRIRLYSRPKISSGTDVKEKLLQLLLTQSQSLLISAGCPIDEGLLTLISKGGNQCKIPEDTRRRFDKWYVQQVLEHRRLSPVGRLPILESISGGNGGNTNVSSNNNSSTTDNSMSTSNGTGGNTNSVSVGGVAGSNSGTVVSVAVAAAVAAAAHRTRMRTSFDPEMELPKLHLWFGENQHPTRLQIQQYVRELNALESRKGRKPLDVNNVVYWFKNARAAYKRAEQRQSNGAGGGGGGGSAGGGVVGVIGGVGSHSPCHDSASNDNLNMCRVISDEGPEDCSAIELLEERRFQLSLDTLVSIDGVDAESKCNKKSSGNKTSSGAIDLSTTHREGTNEKSVNGHWKALERCTTPSLQDVDIDGGVIKQEPTDETTSPVSTDDNDDDDDEEDYDGSSGGCCNNTIGLDESDRKSLTTSSSSSTFVAGTTDVGHFSSSRYGHHHHHHHSHHGHHGHTHSNSSSSSMLYMAGFVPSSVAAALVDERRKRNRTFIDPVSEVPRLEQWFSFNTHPPHSLILKYTDELNHMPYRQKFPRLEPKNVQFWFKNRRAKCKRLRLSVNLVTSPSSQPPTSTSAASAAASW